MDDKGQVEFVCTSDCKDIFVHVKGKELLSTSPFVLFLWLIQRINETQKISKYFTVDPRTNENLFGSVDN